MDDQGRVAGLMWHYEHYMPWVPYNARLRRDLGAPQAAYVANVRRPLPAVAALPQRPAWSSAQIARMTASSDVYNPMNITFR